MAWASPEKVALGSVAFVIWWVLAVFPAVPILPIGRTAGSLLGAVLMVVFQVISPNAAYQAIDLPILGLLFGTMVISVYLERANLFKYLGHLLSWKSYGGKDVLCRICILSAVSSALFTNDTTCVVLTEFVLKLCREKNLPLLPFLLALASSANIGSAATAIGNPQNLVIAVQSRINFGKFLVSVLPAVVVGVLINTLLILVCFWKRLSPKLDIEEGGGHSCVTHEGGREKTPTSRAPTSLISEHEEPEPDSCLASPETDIQGRAVELSSSVASSGEDRKLIRESSEKTFDNNAIKESGGDGNPSPDTRLERPHSRSPRSSESARTSLRRVPYVLSPSDRIVDRPLSDNVARTLPETDAINNWTENSSKVQRRKQTLWLTSVYLVTTGFLAALLAGLNISWSALTAAVVLMVLDFTDAGPSLNKVSYALLVFFSGMFIAVQGFNLTGAPGALWDAVEPHAHIDSVAGLAVLSLVVVVLSNVVSNVPTVLLLGARLAASAGATNGASVTKSWLILAWVSTVAGNLTLLGSAANLIVSEQARNAEVSYNFSFVKHLPFGVPSTLVVIAIGLPLIQG